jgi:hypothetical protein
MCVERSIAAIDCTEAQQRQAGFRFDTPSVIL